MNRLFLILVLMSFAGLAHAQQTTFTPICAGTDDTARFTSIIATIGANTGTIRLPYKNGTRCAVNTLTIPSNITLDNSDGTGLHRNVGAVVTILGPVVSPIGKQMFFGPGTTVFTGNTHIGTNSQVRTSDGVGGESWTTVSGGGGGGAVNTVFGRAGDVIAVTNDYTWAQIDKTGPQVSLLDITQRSADLLSNGTVGTGQIVLRDSPSLITPALGVATATSINGLSIATTTGASISIANAKSFTVSNTLTLASASDGLSGTIPATGTFAMGAASLGVSSTTDSSVANHSHAIASSSNPGAVASILASNTSGHLQLTRLGIGIAPTQPLQVNGNVLISAATANLFLKDTSTGFQSASSTVVTPQANNAIRSTNYTSGLVGWGINAQGDAEFNNVDIRGEIRASVFKVNEVAATAGTFGVFFSASNLSAEAVIPASGSFTFNANNSDAGGMLFAVGDIVRFKGLSTTGNSDTWATITARTNNGTTTQYTANLSSGTISTTYVNGMAVVDYGPSGTGFITLSADGTVGSTPNLSMATHAGSPWSAFTTRVRLGNLNGSYGYVSDVYGFGTGQYGTAGQSWVTVDPTSGVRIGNNTTPRIQLAADGSGFLANSLIAWDTSGNLTVSGNASIAGWTINSNRLSSSTTHIASGFDVPAGAVSWFGKSSGGSSGWVIRDASNRQISAIAGATSPSLPHLAMTDGTFFRVVIGGLNDTFNGGPSVSSMGMKIWNSSGVLLSEFSDVQNIISGWTIGQTKISSTGIDLHSGANAALAFGTTPPTSALAGTGIWLDRTGLYGLASSVVQAKLDATTGAITAGAGNVTLNSNGIRLAEGNLAEGNYIKWLSGANSVAELVGFRAGGDTSFFNVLAKGGNAAGHSQLYLSAERSEGGSFPIIAVTSYGSTHANANQGNIILSSKLGAGSTIIGEGLSTLESRTASTALEVRSTTGAFLPPRMTTTERNALTPAAGMMIFNTSVNKHQGYNGTSWVDFY